MRQRTETALLMVLLVVGLGLLAASVFALGVIVGEGRAQDALPNCQEDEVLFPLQHYKGPGKNAPVDYHCIHIDTFKEK